MPDLFTHLVFGTAFLMLAYPKNRESWILYLLGNIMVDFERPVSLFVKWLGWDWNYIGLFHSFLSVFMLALSISYIIDSSILTQKQRFSLLFLGGLTHLLADLTMHPWSEIGIYLFYPLKIPFSFNLFWPGYIGYPFIALAILLICIAIRIFALNRLSNHHLNENAKSKPADNPASKNQYERGIK
jgi:hypothetical protein